MTIFKKPDVRLLSHSSPMIAEIAARTCYDSFNRANHDYIKHGLYREEHVLPSDYESELAESLVHVHHHESISEHVVVSYEVRGVSRGVLQELARHRIGTSMSVKSTRYTMTDLLIAYHVSNGCDIAFYTLVENHLRPMFCVPPKLIQIEVHKILQMLVLMEVQIGREQMMANTLSKVQIDFLNEAETGPLHTSDKDREYRYSEMVKMKSKRNAGDTVKHIVSDVWSTDLVLTMNARSLKHFMGLRDSGATWEPMRELAKSLFTVTPKNIQALVYRRKNEKE